MALRFSRPRASVGFATPIAFGGLTAMLALAVSTPVCASDATTEGTPKAGTHAGTGGLRVGFVLPYSVMFRYDDSPPCEVHGSETNVCGHAAPLALDLALSYGLTPRVEPYLWTRLGLGGDSYSRTAPLTVLGLGTRFYTSEHNFQLYLDLAAGLRLEGARSAADALLGNYDTDILTHLHFGGQYNFSRNLGAFIQVGPGVSVVRAIEAQFEAGLGIQARWP